MPAWHAMDPDEALRRLESTTGGLTAAAAAARRRTFGRNELPTSGADPWWRILGRQLGSVIVLLLLASSALMATLGRWIDAGAILVAVLIDITLGFAQERRAARDVAALRRLQVRHAHVRRGNGVVRVDATEIVPGDVVVLESGDRVPADARLIEGTALRVDESPLTGESIPVIKSTARMPESTPEAERSGMVWSGTLVVAGRGAGVVVATGSRTAVGEIGALVRESDTPTPLQRLMRRFEARLGIVIGVVALLVLGGGLVLGLGFADAFLGAVSLAVAAIPEGLPVVLTIALSVGVSRMARHRAIVRSLPAVEALGSTTVIAADKTGTMTVNRITLERVWTPLGETVLTDGADPGSEVRSVLRLGALTNDAQLDPKTGELHGDPVDAAIARAALATRAVGVDEFRAEPMGHIPYEPERRSSATIVAGEDGAMLVVKGSADLVLAASVAEAGREGPQPLEPDRIRDAHDSYAEAGMRVIAIGHRLLEPGEEIAAALADPRHLELAGLFCMTDPPRPGVEEAIAACHAAGIAVMMITGDHPRTAAAIGARLGVGGAVDPVTGRELGRLRDDELVARLRRSRIAARVSPRDDAPALRAASLGVAMGRGGTDVARDAADIVLTDDDFSTIVRAVRQGRITFSAVQKATFFLVSTGLAALVAVVGDLLVGGPLIFLPVQMIWFNLVANGLQDVGLAFEGAEGDELSRPPRPPRGGLLSARWWLRAVVTSAWMGGVVLAAFHTALRDGAAVDQARTLALTTFAFLTLFQTFNSRSETRSVFRQRPWSNPFLLAAALGSIALHVVAVVTPFGGAVLGLAPLTMAQWGLAAALGASVLALVESGKAMVRLRRRWASRSESARSPDPAPSRDR